jgi:fibronectin-binding autotransporter adhesin
MRRLAAGAVAAVAALTCASTALAGTIYTLNPGDPPTVNWSDTTKWIPSTGYPGSQPGDSANAPSSTSTVNLDVQVPNPLDAFAFICTGCTFNFPAGGGLTLAGSGVIGDGTAVTINGGALAVASGGTLSFGSSPQTVALNSGTLDVQSGGAATNALVNGTGTLSVDGSVGFKASSAVGELTGSGTVTMPNAGGLTVGGADSADLFSGVYQDGSGGSATLTKTGTGTLTLTGSNTYTGSTDIQQGGLTVQGSVAGPVTIENGATLTCDGSIGGAVTIQTGGQLVVQGGCQLNGGITGMSPTSDGNGTVEYNGYPASNGTGDNGFEFDLSLPSGQDFVNGTLELTVPSGWTAPSTNSADGGYTTSDCGNVSASGQVITVSGIVLAGGDSCEVFYGDLPGPGVTVPTTPGPYTFSARTKATSFGTLTAIGTSPSVQVLAPDGSGTMVSDTDSVAASSTGNTITFTYTAAFGGIFDGLLSLRVPGGWSPPSDTDTDPGYVTATLNGVPYPFIVSAPPRVYAFILGMDGGDELALTYGDKTNGPGATATATAGRKAWPTYEQSSCSCDSQLLPLAVQPVIRVRAPDGSGTMTTKRTVFSASTRQTMVFTYRPAAGGMLNGAVSLDVPAGWSAPSTTPGADGYVTATGGGTVSTLGQTITVSGLNLTGGGIEIKYGSRTGGGLGALVPSTPGPATWTAKQRSGLPGTLTPLANSPSITVYAADGSGTLTTPTSSVTRGSTGNTITFTYTAAGGGMSNGSVAMRVGAGWSAPSTTGTSAGFSTASTGTLSTSGQTIVVTGVTLSGGQTLTITYGATGGGGPGATAPNINASQLWRGAQASTPGSRTVVASSPVISLS